MIAVLLLHMLLRPCEQYLFPKHELTKEQKEMIKKEADRIKDEEQGEP